MWLARTDFARTDFAAVGCLYWCQQTSFSAARNMPQTGMWVTETRKLQVPRSFWLLLKRIHRRAARRRRTVAALQACGCVAMLMANCAITMLVAGGFTAGRADAKSMVSCVNAVMLYVVTFAMVALSVVLDFKLRKQRRRLYRLLLCLDADRGA